MDILHDLLSSHTFGFAASRLILLGLIFPICAAIADALGLPDKVRQEREAEAERIAKRDAKREAKHPHS